MLGMLFRVFAMGVLFLAVLGVLALVGHADKWWLAAGVAVVGYFGVAFLVKRLLVRAFTAPFQAKGAPLRGASLEVHAVRPAPALAVAAVAACCGVGAGGGGGDDDGEPEEDDAPSRKPGWRYFEVEATVTPTGTPSGPFRHWEPGELCVVPYEARTDARGVADEEDVADLERVEVFEDGVYVAHEGRMFDGPRRLRLTVGVAPSHSVAKLRYYFEGFGRLEFPAGA